MTSEERKIIGVTTAAHGLNHGFILIFKSFVLIFSGKESKPKNRRVAWVAAGDLCILACNLAGALSRFRFPLPETERNWLRGCGF